MDPLLIGFLVIAIAGLLFMNSRARKRQNEATAFRSSLQPGQEVMTASGLFGTVVSVDGDRVTLSSAGGHETVWLNAAIAKLVDPPAAEETDEDATEADEDSAAIESGEASDVVPDSPAALDPTHPESADGDPRTGRPDDSSR